MTEWPVVVSSDRFPRHLLQFNTLLSVMLSIAVLTNEVCDCFFLYTQAFCPCYVLDVVVVW